MSADQDSCCDRVQYTPNQIHEMLTVTNTNTTEDNKKPPAPLASSTSSQLCLTNNRSRRQSMLRFFRSSFMGMVLCFISSLLLSLGTLMVSRMTHFHPITKSFWRFGGTFFFSAFVIIYYAFKKESITSSFWPLRLDTFKVFASLALRSFFGCTGATLQYYSLKYMALGDSSVICNSYPVIVTVLAHFFLGEPFGGIFMFVATLVTFLGVTMIVRPPILTGETLNTELMIGAALAIACAVFMAGAIVMVRHLQQIHHSIQLICFGGFGSLETAVLAYWIFDVLEFPTDTIDILKACAVGFLSCASQMFLIFALKCDNAGPVALVKTTDVLFAFIWQMLFIDVFPDIISILGALVMMSGIFLCGFKKYIDSLGETHSMKKIFWFVTK